jgi:methionine-rich copper-binding protein CopC
VRQLSQKVWPALRAKRPAAHASHAARPDSGWLRPASHARQTRAPAALTLPASQASHWTFSGLAAVSSAARPASQASQRCCPGADW